MSDPIESAIRSGAVTALRKRAATQAGRAMAGTVIERGVTIRTSEAAHAGDIARQLARIADEIEAE